MELPPPARAGLQLLAGFRVPVPAAWLGIDVAQRLCEAGLAVITADDRIRISPMARGEAANATDLLAVLRDDDLDEALFAEGIRLALIVGDAGRAVRYTTAVLDRAVLAGTAAAVVAPLMDHGAAADWVSTCRDPALRLMVEGGRLADVEAHLGPDDAPLLARWWVRIGQPERAVEALVDPPDLPSRVVVARALLHLGRPRQSLQLLQGAPRDRSPTTLDALEVEELTWLARVELDAPPPPLADLDVGAAGLIGLDRRLLRARIHLRLGHHGAATADLDAIRSGLVDRRAPRIWTQAEFLDALCAFYIGNHDRLAAQLRRLSDLGDLGNQTVWHHARIVEAIARSAWGEAEAVLEALGGSNHYGLRTMVASIAIQRGALDEAEEALAFATGESELFADDIDVLQRRIAYRRGQIPPPPRRRSPCLTIAASHLLLDGQIALDRGDAVAARALADQAEAILDQGQIGVYRPDAALLRADIAARGGRIDEALHLLDLAEAALPHPDAPASRTIEAARGRLTGQPVDPAPWRALPDPVAVAIATGRSPRFDPGWAGPRLRVAADGAAFQIDDTAPIDLARRRPLRRLLLRLAQATVDGQGPLDLAALLAAGWPGEQVVPDAAANRVHVALHQLRRLGLSGWIVHIPDGWILRSDARTEIVEELPTA